MSITKILGLALLQLLPLLTVIAPAPARSDDSIKFAVIEDFSTAPDRAKRIMDLYNDFVKRTNDAGGMSIGHSRYKLEVSFEDSQSKPDVALMKARQQIDQQHAAVIICNTPVCSTATEQAKTPLILTAAGRSLFGKESRTFLINAPSGDDYETQGRLAIKALDQALTRTTEPTPDKILDALREVNVSNDIGSVRFDKSGNNVGRVTYPFRQMTGINQSGCSKSCGKSCPSDCGKTACSKDDGDNQCCNICGMPQPPR